MPSVDIDRGQGIYSVTLQLSGTPALPKTGDEFIVQGATPNATVGLRNVTYTSSSGLAYLPEILVTTDQGTFNYRMLLQSIPDSQPFRLKVVSLAQNGSATYDLATGELHLPLVNINHGLQSYDILLKRADGKTGLVEEGHEFVVIGYTDAPEGLFDAAYDGSTDSSYVGQVLINDNGRVLNYRIRLQGIPVQGDEVWRGKVVSMALNGSDGIPGPQGIKGDKGDKGDTGAKGEKGDKGDPGSQGTEGNTILSGNGAPTTTLGKEGDFYIDTSAKIIYGPKSNGTWNGAASLIGPAGANGSDGVPGTQGIKGDKGDKGDPGEKGDKGDTGEKGEKGDKGDPGLQGTDGNTILSGSGAPTAILGNEGDFYIDTVAKTIYGPKSSGVWGNAADLTGPAGAMGAQGVAGATGDQGPAGPQGLTGAPGPQGIAGQGVPTGGSAGQILAKINATDYNTQWVNLGTFTDLNITGNTTLGDAVTDTVTINGILQGASPLKFEGATANGFNTSLAIIDPTANQTITLPNASGTVILEPTTACTNGQILKSNGSGGWTCSAASGGAVTSTDITDGEIVNADINASAAIADTKLATIATAGKVANSATTATSSNTNSAIVARDVSGNFAAGTITANLAGNVTGNASTATALAANGTNCTAGNYPLGVDASGNAENCTAVSGGGTVTSVSGTAPISVATGTTTPAISLGTVPIANGGTGVTSLTSGYLSSNGTTITSSATLPAADISGTLSDSQVVDALTVSGGTINNTPIGATTASTGKFTTLDITGNSTLGGAATDTVTINGILQGTSPLKFEGATANSFNTTLAIIDPTANQTIALPNASGTVVLEPITPCTNGQILKSNGASGWTCMTVSGAGTVTSVASGTGLTGGTITASGTLSLADTAVTAGSYTAANITVDAQGRLTAATSNPIASTSTANAIVARDASGNFAAGTITANLTGNVTGNASSATNFSGSLTGDVTGTQTATTVAKIQGIAVASTTPTNGQIFTYNGTSSKWEPTSSSAMSLSANETIIGNWVNIANPWADDEVVDALTISGGTINNTPIGATIASTGKFTTLDITGNSMLGDAATDTVTINGILQGMSPLKFEGTTANTSNTTLAIIDPTANQTIALPNASGTVVLEPITPCTNGQILKSNGSGGWICTTGSIASTDITDGEIVNADINAAAAIADTKLATITTAGKVANSATTATSNNTNGAIVARDASGNFAAGTITASLTGNVTGNASTATALAANGTNCTAGSYPLGVDASGIVEDCTTAVSLSANETITGNWVNTTNPWADNEVVDTLTISGGTINNTPIGATTASTGKFTTLETGTLKVTGGTPAAGKVLASDASGNASWQTGGWNLTGNAGTDGGTTHFIGTTDNKALVFKVNGWLSGSLSPIDYNASWGYQALYNNSSSSYNVAIGYRALYANTNGNYNVAIGSQALNSNTTGTNNVANGMNAGTINTTGTNNTFVGYGADASTTNLSNATAIGNGAIVDASNKVRIGNTSVTVIEGKVAWSSLSDKRLKTNILPNHKGLDFISKLQPVTFQWKEGDTTTIHDGFIAQDVEVAMNELGVTFSGLHKPQNDKDHYSLEYSTFVVPLVNAVKEQQAIIKQQTAEIADLKAQNQQMLERLIRLEAALAK